MAEALILDLFGIPQGESSRDLQITGADLDARMEQVEIVSPIAIHLDLYRSGDSIRCRGRFDLRIKIVCSRCLEAGEQAVGGSFELFAARREGSVSEEDRHSLEDGGMIFHDGMVLDLNEEIRQTVLLELPWNPVCADDCRGLCARCGKNLNRGPCACKTRPVDSRWAALEDLNKDEES
jgi:uncharacterized protein